MRLLSALENNPPRPLPPPPPSPPPPPPLLQAHPGPPRSSPSCAAAIPPLIKYKKLLLKVCFQFQLAPLRLVPVADDGRLPHWGGALLGPQAGWFLTTTPPTPKELTPHN